LKKNTSIMREFVIYYARVEWFPLLQNSLYDRMSV